MKFINGESGRRLVISTKRKKIRLTVIGPGVPLNVSIDLGEEAADLVAEGLDARAAELARRRVRHHYRSARRP